MIQGLALSGGQKQRVGIARAVYANGDVQIFDDPLSSLDSHVGHRVFENVLLNAPKGKTRVIVTHAIHVLPKVDYVFTITDGRIGEHGTYAELMAANGGFASLVRQFGKQEAEHMERTTPDPGATLAIAKMQATNTNTAIMSSEERNIGAVSGDVYAEYLKAGNGMVFLPLLFVTLLFVQALSISSSYWLVWWQADHFHRDQSFYVCPPLLSSIVILHNIDDHICSHRHRSRRPNQSFRHDIYFVYSGRVENPLCFGNDPRHACSHVILRKHSIGPYHDQIRQGY